MAHMAFVGDLVGADLRAARRAGQPAVSEIRPYQNRTSSGTTRWPSGTVDSRGGNLDDAKRSK